MNPSLLVDNDKMRINLRQVNYAFYHSEKNLFHHPFGPLTYIHPEDDIKLRTWNWLLDVDEHYQIIEYTKTDTSKFDTYEPKWDFVGLEDARLVRWDDKLFQVGVRRDTTTNGQGRMELSEIDENGVEISRQRIPTPSENSYCEKNWMPVLDQPYTFIKWSNPTEIVRYNPKTKKTQQLQVVQQNLKFDTRGGSQVVPYGDKYYAITHDVDLFKSDTGRKNAHYTHRILVWDKDWNLLGATNRFNFMDGMVEFCTGLAFHRNKVLMTFGFQDNAAYLFEMEHNNFMEFIDENSITN